MEEMKGRCKYCKTEIDKTDLRCSACNFIWCDGFRSGEERVENELMGIFWKLRSLAGFEKKNG